MENRHARLLSRPEFVRRQASYTAIALAIVGGSLWIGMLGYRTLEHMSWIDAFVNAAMLLGGMGPVGQLQTYGGKLFAGLYAIYCGMVLIISVGVLIAPLLHRVMHRFHLELEKE